MMIRREHLAAVLLATGAPAAAQAAPTDERLASPPLPAFVVGYEAADAAQSIREEVPKGETVQAWTRMVTTQRLVGAASRGAPAAFAGMIAGSMARSCPGATASPVTATTVSGHPAARIKVDCPMNAGKPESFLFLAVAGEADLHIKQAAVRGADAARGLGWGDALLSATVLCPAGKTAPPPCR